MKPGKILLIGGCGFVGRSIAAQLAAQDIQLTVPTRRRERNRAVALLPRLSLVEADVNNPEVLAGLMVGQDAVINLAGILHDGSSGKPYGKRFAATHVGLPEKIVSAMRKAGVRRLLHMSALKAAPDAPSAYLRSKAAGEAAVLAAKDLDVTVFRPSVIFGPDDAFLNQFAMLAALFPVLPVGGVQARFQPVFVGDVAKAFANALADPASIGQTYELCGPQTYTLRELIAYAANLSGHPRCIIGLPEPLARLQAGLLSLLPNPPMSPDNLRSMQVDNVSDGSRNPPGWQPVALESVAPAYLSRLQPEAHYDAFRFRAGRK